ncbi:MAG: RDD family protein [Alphaproteobacteria bacterium]|nr:RDD family protein [Alphaproteobacteria bacterium]
MKRKLTTIFCADVSGYSRMMGADEARTLSTLKEYREAIEGFIARHHGRVVSWSGDGLLAEFSSVVEAVQCAAEVQSELKLRNGGRDEEQRMTFRIGINLGDVMADGDDIFGEGVNIAARLQQMAAPGGILVSAPVYEQVRGKLSMQFAALGQQAVKNIAGEVGVYSVTVQGVTPAMAMAGTPAWGDPAPAAPPPAEPKVVEKRAKLARRAVALLLDYMIVGVGCLAAGVALNMTINPSIVRMDLDLPFIDYGDVVAATPWVVTKTEKEDKATITHEERTVTYDYWGLFTQTYGQTRISGEAILKDAREPDGVAAPNPPAPPAAPDAPAPPAPPTPPDVDVPGVVIKDGEVSIGGGAVVVGQNGSVRIAHDDDDDDGWLSLSLGYDEDEGLKGRFRHREQHLVDPGTLKPITRLSLDTLSLIVLVIYFALMEGGAGAASLGKRAFDLAVTREDGAKLSFGAALGRNIVKVLTFFIFPVTIIVALFSRRRRAIHDLIARTVVVHRLS